MYFHRHVASSFFFLLFHACRVQLQPFDTQRGGCRPEWLQFMQSSTRNCHVLFRERSHSTFSGNELFHLRLSGSLLSGWDENCNQCYLIKLSLALIYISLLINNLFALVNNIYVPFLMDLYFYSVLESLFKQKLLPARFV